MKFYLDGPSLRQNSMPAPAGIFVSGEKQADSSACAGDSKGFACKRIRGPRSCGRISLSPPGHQQKRAARPVFHFRAPKRPPIVGMATVGGARDAFLHRRFPLPHDACATQTRSPSCASHRCPSSGIKRERRPCHSTRFLSPHCLSLPDDAHSARHSKLNDDRKSASWIRLHEFSGMRPIN